MKNINVIKTYFIRIKTFFLKRKLNSKIKSFLKTIDDKNKEQVMLILNNQRDYLVHYNVANPIFYFSIVLNSINDYLMLGNIVGLQPIPGPVGQLFTMNLESSGKWSNISHAIVANARKLKTSLPITYQQLDGNEDALVSSTSKDIMKEIVSNTLEELVNLSTIQKQPASKKTFDSKVLSAAKNISKTSGRGVANIMIVSTDTFNTMVKNSKMFTPEEITSNQTSLQYEGTFDNMKVFVSSQFQDKLVLIGYTGGPTDTGFVLSPYITINPRVMPDVETYQPTLQFVTRYGTHTNYTDKYYRSFRII